MLSLQGRLHDLVLLLNSSYRLVNDPKVTRVISMGFVESGEKGDLAFKWLVYGGLGVVVAILEGLAKCSKVGVSPFLSRVSTIVWPSSVLETRLGGTSLRI